MSEEFIGAAALTGRYVLGLVFVTAALPKLVGRRQFAQAVSNYALLPERLVPRVATWLPRTELLCGVALLLGIAVEAMAAVAAVLLVAFAGAVAVSLLRGKEIDCGCSGSVAPRRIGWPLVAGDVGLAMAAAGVVAADPGVLTLVADRGSDTSGLSSSDGAASLTLAAALVLHSLLLSAWFRVRRVSRTLPARLGAAA